MTSWYSDSDNNGDNHYGAGASADMELTYFTRNILVLAPESLILLKCMFSDVYTNSYCVQVTSVTYVIADSQKTLFNDRGSKVMIVIRD